MGNANQGKLATIQPLPPLPQASSFQSFALTSTTAAQKIQNLNDSLATLNPKFKPLGFTINSLSSCSESVLKDALVATRTAMSTILSTIAPGQEASLWQLVRPEMDKFVGSEMGRAEVSSAKVIACKGAEENA